MFLKHSIREAEHAWELVRAIFDMNPDPMLVLDNNGRMVIANTAISNFLISPKKKLKEWMRSTFNPAFFIN